MKAGYKPDERDVFDKYNRSVQFKQQLGLYETVEENENIFIGKRLPM